MIVKKYIKIFCMAFCCLGIFVANTCLWAIDYKYSQNKQANEFFKTGLLYNNAQKYTRAIPYFEKAWGLDPNFAAALFELAFALQNSGETDKAIDFYEKGFAIEPQFLPAYSQIALLHIERGEVFESYKWLKKGRSLYPNDQCINQMIRSVESQCGQALSVAEAAQKNSDNVSAGVEGKGVFIGPKYYKKNEKPVSAAEQKLFDEYSNKVQYFHEENIDEMAAGEQMLKWYAAVFKQYNISARDFNYLLRKMTYGEIPPESYSPPKYKE